MLRRLTTTLMFTCSLLIIGATCYAEKGGARKLTFVGYPDFIALETATTRVVLCPHAGGRVLEYALRDENALYLEEQHTGVDYQPGKPSSMSAIRSAIALSPNP